MTRVALLWHMHQPFYEDLATHEHILPWVRLHALKDYYGMVAMLREFPDVRMTFNLVPSMLVQLEAFAEDRARDRTLELSLKPADQLDAGDVEFVLENFFHAQRQRMIDTYPRYAELRDRRGDGFASPGERAAAAARFSRDDLRDLQVWHKLAWIDPLYLDGDPRIVALVGKGRGFSESDKIVLREVELELLNKVIPEYRDAAARGQIEISASPFYHPILPLLCDTEIYKRTHPDTKLPRRRFQRPEDATEQLSRAVACHERLFGRRPVGLWPSEGSVSDAMVPLVAGAGFRWMATDEMILGRTLGLDFSRDSRGQVEQPERLYTPYRVRVGQAEVSCMFRDHVLSDLIGFTYSGWEPEAAADDFVTRMADAGARYRAQTGGGEAIIPIILDGENAWEHFAGGGRPFLRALYRRLSGHQELQTVTMAEACRAGGPELPGIFPGSWIDANFYIWIGHADDRTAWSQLGDARAALDGAGADIESAAEAREEILIAEGSDWFWWYGDDHSSAHDEAFDDLFRRHLRNAYQRLQLPVPGELYVSNITTGGLVAAQTQPTALLSPVLDGEVTSYFEWLGAGLFEVQEVAGAMHRTDASPAAVSAIRFGFDRSHLFVRIDGARPLHDLLNRGEVRLTFVAPEGVQFVAAMNDGRPVGRYRDQAKTPSGWRDRGAGGASVAAGDVLELSLPLADLSLSPGQAVAFVVEVHLAGVELERYPASRPIAATVPDRTFEARQWRA
jgi:alpha-amylase/alpha-mannosidase (GH57 family)